jgi:hypothetical protein
VLGISPIMQNKETVALMIAAERFAALFFANGAQPSMILEYDRKLPNDEVAQRIRAGIERVYGGLDNKWKVAILELFIVRTWSKRVDELPHHHVNELVRGRISKCLSQPFAKAFHVHSRRRDVPIGARLGLPNAWRRSLADQGCRWAWYSCDHLLVSRLKANGSSLTFLDGCVGRLEAVDACLFH